jgi:hypothetical protein
MACSGTAFTYRIQSRPHINKEYIHTLAKVSVLCPGILKTNFLFMYYTHVVIYSRWPVLHYLLPDRRMVIELFNLLPRRGTYTSLLHYKMPYGRLATVKRRRNWRRDEEHWTKLKYELRKLSLFNLCKINKLHSKIPALCSGFARNWTRISLTWSVCMIQ